MIPILTNCINGINGINEWMSNVCQSHSISWTVYFVHNGKCRAIASNNFKPSSHQLHSSIASHCIPLSQSFARIKHNNNQNGNENVNSNNSDKRAEQSQKLVGLNQNLYSEIISSSPHTERELAWKVNPGNLELKCIPSSNSKIEICCPLLGAEYKISASFCHTASPFFRIQPAESFHWA